LHVPSIFFSAQFSKSTHNPFSFKVKPSIQIPQAVPSSAFGKCKPVQVACSATYTAVIVDDGSISVFGLGSLGRSVLAEEARPHYLKTFKGKRAAQISCGPCAMAALVTQRHTPDYRLAGWVPDSEAPVCMGCEAPFTTLRRRHHCRKCEGVFCSQCCHWKVPLLSKGFADSVRVCYRCHSALKAMSHKKPSHSSGNSSNNGGIGNSGSGKGGSSKHT